MTSQFEQQVRICTGMPLGSTELKFPVRMTNVLGDAWFTASSTPQEPDWSEWTRHGAAVHLYGKKEPRKGRKMGHITQPLTA